MSQKLLSGLTATLLVSTTCLPLIGNGKSAVASDRTIETNPKIAANQSPSPVLDLTSEVVKLGEKQTNAPETTAVTVVAKVHTHELAGREAATLYVRNIPILTFLGAEKAAAETVKMGTQLPPAGTTGAFTKSLESQSLDSQSLDSQSLDSAVASRTTVASLAKPAPEAAKPPVASTESSETTPVWRASEIAARLNQLNRDGVDATAITVIWDNQSNKFGGDRFIIKVKEETLAIVDANTILPDTTNDLERDALQAVNRLRRVLGNAAPLKQVSGKPRQAQEISLGSFRMRLNGWASWYGPYFHGARSASGEVFNQNALTAAHRELPFGTLVRVTNRDNGRSVVVRINDRGPALPDRIIDVSAAAAGVLGMVQSGVAPVSLEIVTQEDGISSGK